MKPLVSVVITTKNEEKYLDKCLISIKNQTYKPIEIIVTDSVSADRTVEVAKKYTNKVFVEKTNIAAGRNLGAKYAKGEILFFVDADTILLPDTIEKMLKPFKNKRVVGAACPILPATVDIYYVILYLLYNRFVKTSIKTKRPQVTGLCSAYRHEAFKKIGGFKEDFGTLEDFNLSEKISKLGKIVFVDNTEVITSHRRIRSWGKINSVKKYVAAYIKYLLTKKGFDIKGYRPVR